MRVYTKTGDDGSTGRFLGGRLPKADVLVGATGDLDEAVAVLGVARAGADEDVAELLLARQRELFVVGADLIANPDHRERLEAEVSLVTESMVVTLEGLIDDMVARRPLRPVFVVPGSDPTSAHLDHARTVVRRAERHVLAARSSGHLVTDAVVRYLNRLSTCCTSWHVRWPVTWNRSATTEGPLRCSPRTEERGMSLESDECRLRTAAGELIARGFVRQHAEDAMVIDTGEAGSVWFAEGDDAVVEVLNGDRGTLTYHGVVEMAAARRLRLVELRMQTVEQRRAALRVATDLQVPVVAQVVGPEEVPLDPPWQVAVVDLSAYGVRFIHEQELEVGSRWRIRLSAPRRPLELVAEVVRVEPVRVSFASGCRFVDATEAEHDVLFRWVLDLQRALLARRAGQR